MHTIDVDLPPDELISPGILVKAIVKALCPGKTEELAGLDCIVGKWVEIVTPPPARNPDLFGNDNEPAWKNPFSPVGDGMALSPQLELPLPKIELTQDLVNKVIEDENGSRFYLPYRLTDEDRAKLRPLLDSLPPLTYPMTEHAISRFMDAYLAHPERPNWMPEIITWETIQERLEEQSAAFEKHMDAIRLAIESGQLSACDNGRVPTRGFSLGALISRNGAIEYLKRYGLSVRGELQPATRGDDDEQRLQDGVYIATDRRVLAKSATQGQENWTEEELEAIKCKLGSIDPRTQKKYTNKRVAELIGLKSPGRITQLMKQLKIRQAKPLTPWGIALMQTKQN